MGTPEFACPTLEKIISDTDFEIVAIYTKEPKIAGRGHKLTNSPIHELALAHDLKVITPKTLRDQVRQKEFTDLQADIAIVVAYGLILPTEILNGTKFGCVNIHPSPLPHWRGAAPIQRQIMNGDVESGITIIKMNEGIDSGDVIYQENFLLNLDETYQNLSKKLSVMGAEILVKILKKNPDGKFILTRQDDALATYASKIEKMECEIDWKSSAKEIERKIRGLSGSLGAYFNNDGEKIKILSAKIIEEDSCKFAPGEIIDDRLSIQCSKGVIRPIILQRQGRRAMDLREFLLGFNGASQK